MLDLLVDVVTHSWFTLMGTLLLLAAFALSVISGLIDIAVYIMLIGGALFLTYALIATVV